MAGDSNQRAELRPATALRSRGATAMTNLSVTMPHSPASGIAPLRAKWGWIVALGVVYFIVGLIALGSVVTATAASVLIVGIMMVIAGIAEIVNAFQVKSWGKFLLWLLDRKSVV